MTKRSSASAIAAFALAGMVFTPGTAFAQSLVVPEDGNSNSYTGGVVKPGGREDYERQRGHDREEFLRDDDVPIFDKRNSDGHDDSGTKGKPLEDGLRIGTNGVRSAKDGEDKPTSSSTENTDSPSATSTNDADKETESDKDKSDSDSKDKLTADFVESKLEDRGEYRFYDATCGLGQYIDTYKDTFKGKVETCDANEGAHSAAKKPGGTEGAVAPTSDSDKVHKENAPEKDKANKPTRETDGAAKPTETTETKSHPSVTTTPSPEPFAPDGDHNGNKNEATSATPTSDKEFGDTNKARPTDTKVPADSTETNSTGKPESTTDKTDAASNVDLKKQVVVVSKQAKGILNDLNKVDGVADKPDAGKYVDYLFLLASLGDKDNAMDNILSKDGTLSEYLAQHTHDIVSKRSTVDLAVEGDGLDKWLESMDKKYSKDGVSLLEEVKTLNELATGQGGK